MDCGRRSLLLLAASACGVFAFEQGAVAQERVGDARHDVREAVRRFAALSDAASCLIDAAHPRDAWTEAHDADRALFVGSAVKTFILAE
jgi:beta-lactamase class A